MIRVDGSQFVDEHGRTLILRGVNLGGSSKVPYRPNGATHMRKGFYAHRDVSFVGRPFPLARADEHLSRLQAWGMTFVRFLVTWEAIEHAGPGEYDQDYLDYLHAVIERAAAHGIDILIDPHQDAWSRFSGGDGAPGWTLEVVGMDITQFAETGAAIVHATHGDPFPHMIWPTNYDKLGAATMSTLFFGGDDFAPRTRVDGAPVQAYLQAHYLNALKQVATHLKDLPNVVGYEVMNEPIPGFIGVTDLNDSAHARMRLGPAPTPFQAMLLGDGIPQQVEEWDLKLTGPKVRGRRWLNASRMRAWQEGCPCIWRENGVWDVTDDRPQLLRPDHFCQVEGRRVSFADDYLRPFANRFAQHIRSVDPEAIIFVEGIPHTEYPGWRSQNVPNVVHAPHWYDVVTLIRKRHAAHIGADPDARRVILGQGRVQRAFAEQVARLIEWSEKGMGGVPTLIGEFGIPFDLEDGRAYRSGDWSRQVRALDASYRAMDANLASCTLWNYTADNDNRHGDQWNGEDLSIYSPDQRSDPSDVNSGGRGLEAAVRPYASKVAGQPLRMAFDVRKGTFEFEFRHDPSVEAPTELFVPTIQYPEGYAIEVSDGTYEANIADQTITYQHSSERETHRLRISRAK